MMTTEEAIAVFDTTEVLPLRYGLVATLTLHETDRADVYVRSHPHPHGCTCDRCVRIYNSKDGRP